MTCTFPRKEVRIKRGMVHGAIPPGWPTLLLADFVDAFDDHALATYRAAVSDVEPSARRSRRL
jgi:hypothetical protein